MALVITNKINQATKYDGGIGDNKQDKPSNQIWRRNWWCGITFLSSSYSISTKLSRHLHVYATEPDERVLVCGCCGIVCKTGFSFPSSVQLWDWMHCGITNGTATKNNQRVWSCLLWNNQRVWFACCEITFSSASCWDNGAWRERLLLDWFGWCWRCFTNLADNEICIFMALVKKISSLSLAKLWNKTNPANSGLDDIGSLYEHLDCSGWQMNVDRAVDQYPLHKSVWLNSHNEIQPWILSVRYFSFETYYVVFNWKIFVSCKCLMEIFVFSWKYLCFMWMFHEYICVSWEYLFFMEMSHGNLCVCSAKNALQNRKIMLKYFQCEGTNIIYG